MDCRSSPKSVARTFLSARQALLISTFLPFCWLAMQSVHELGHVLAARATAGEVRRVVLNPLTISRTDVAPNPRPLLVCWAGPLMGAVLPFIAYLSARLARFPQLFLFRFFAGFCLIANGVYIGAGAFEGVGDAGDLLRLGMPIGALVGFGVFTAPWGLWMWHGQRESFANANWRSAWISTGLLTGIVILNSVITWLS